MSIEFEEIEDPLTLLGSLIVTIASGILLIMSSIGMAILGGARIYGTNFTPIGYSFVLIFVLLIIILLLSLFCLLRNRIKYKINIFTASVLSLILDLAIFLSLASMAGEINDDIATIFYLFVFILLGGIFVIFISKRPNIGKESNKHIYQAYGAVIEVILGLGMLFIGVYFIIIDVSQFAGSGTFPGGFETTFLQEYASITTIYNQIRYSGVIIIIGAVIIIGASIARSKITLKVAVLVIIGGIITELVGISLFYSNWNALGLEFQERYSEIYEAQLKLVIPMAFFVGIVLILLMFVGLIMITYATTQDEPLEKWRSRRNHSIAAAEVAIRDQKLNKGIKYLEQAAMWSSKLGEEDRAVELITRINNIKEKAIKMRKSEAAEKKKKELEKAKEKALKKPKELQKAVDAKK